MSTIRCIYKDRAPKFPAREQHPDALRYGPITIDALTIYVDAIGGRPTDDELRAVISPPAPRRLVSRAVIVDRLIAAGKLDAARTALDAAPLDVREKWNARASIYADDETAISLLREIGADPTVVMAE